MLGHPWIPNPHLAPLGVPKTNPASSTLWQGRSEHQSKDSRHLSTSPQKEKSNKPKKSHIPSASSQEPNIKPSPTAGTSEARMPARSVPSKVKSTPVPESKTRQSY
ncbi:XK-related protein 7 [Platysternon megacephalum]|uniref:XK-related protein 7 n=1 Tax=Platysternon megacephalum TaxID=55544 RepID=A0A4D9E1X5_9SAUR|nr:XK-related protein 7 [Platysternon megacephalum]